MNKGDASIIGMTPAAAAVYTEASRVCGQWPAAIGTEVEACDWQSVSRSVRCQIPIVPIVIDIVIKSRRSMTADHDGMHSPGGQSLGGRALPGARLKL